MLCCAMLCRAMLCYAVLCCAVPFYAMICYVMLCYAMLCCAMLGLAVLCYVMLCCAMLSVGRRSSYSFMSLFGISTITYFTATFGPLCGLFLAKNCPSGPNTLGFFEGHSFDPQKTLGKSPLWAKMAKQGAQNGPKCPKTQGAGPISRTPLFTGFSACRRLLAIYWATFGPLLGPKNLGFF